jgi:endo-alpha-1,4-polygalactosaminidase (GH114 family)
MVLVSESLNLLNVGHCIADFRHFEELRDEVRAVRKAGAWIVYLVHGVGAESKEIYIERDVHERLLDFLVGEQDVWTRPFIEVASWIRRWREGQPAT